MRIRATLVTFGLCAALAPACASHPTPMNSVDASHPIPHDAAPTLVDGGRCSGTPVPCEDRALAECVAGDGCITTECTGTPLACGSVALSQCETVVGCTYDRSTAECVGTARSCTSSSFATLAACYGQRGCVWGAETVCGGAPAPCNARSNACETFPGCGDPAGFDAGDVPDVGVDDAG